MFKPLKKYFLSVVFLSLSSVGFSQNPAHFFIGENEFANTHVYSLKYHPNGLLYAATNYGLYVYKNGSFKLVPFRGDHQGSSLFSLSLDSQNDLFCSNMSGQIFNLINDSLRLFTEVDEKYLNKNSFDFIFDADDNILIKSFCLVQYNGKEWKELGYGKDYQLNFNGVNPKNVLLVWAKGTRLKSIGEYESVLKKEWKHKLGQKGTLSFFPILFNNNLVSISNHSQLVDYDNNTIESLIEDGTYRITQTTLNSVWLLDDAKGLYNIDLNNRILKPSKKYFPNTFISAICESKDGVVFLGTFGGGVIVIPSIKTLEYKSDFGMIKSIAKVDDLTELNNLHRLKVVKRGEDNFLLSFLPIFYSDKISFERNNAPTSFLIQGYVQDKLNGSYGYIKDVCAVDSSALIATSTGLYRVGKGFNHITWIQNGSDSLWWRYNNKSVRYREVAYSKKNNEIYYSTLSGLYVLDQNGKEKEIVYKGESLMVSDIYSNDSLTICGTHNYGLLYIDNGTVSKQLSTTEGLSDNFVRKVSCSDGKIYVVTRKGFQIFNLKTDKWKSLGKYFNVIKNSVSNMLIEEDGIYLTSKDKMLIIPEENVLNEFPFTFQISSINLGGSLISNTGKLSSSYDRNSLEVGLDFRGILYENEAEIQYLFGNSDLKSISATSANIRFEAIAPGSYSLKIRVKYGAEFTAFKVVNFEIIPPYWQRWWFYVLVVLVVVSIIGIIAYRRILKLRKQNKEQVETQKLKASLLDTELKALRSQMNPHFIFNSLNSIQDLILKEDTDGSYDYVVLFANLVRSTLNYSNKDFIPIEKEIEFLEVYLKLEKLRFGDEFIYQINYKGTDAIEVPSLIVQPFIENALIHGLLHKEGVKNLSISFELSEDLKCIITDNGVGRQRSKEINERQGGNHESFALDAIKKRLEILSNKDGGSFGYVVTDLYQDKVPSGTQIKVTIPYRLLY